MAPLDAIVAVDALVAPLTGIGRYAYELVKGLQAHDAIGRLRYFSLGRWRKDPFALLGDARVAGGSGAASTPGGGQLERWRARLAQNQLAARAYALAVPHVERWQLRREGRDVLFHAPNYFVPRFPGRRVSTVHDLSFIRYPEFHPKVRVDFVTRVLKRSLHGLDQIITDSEAVKQEVMDTYGWPAERITAIGLGVDPSFRPRSEAVLAEPLSTYGLRQQGYGLFVGTVEPRKNVDRLLDAYGALPMALRAEWPLVIAGAAGWRSEGTHARILEAQRQGWVKYLSFVPQRDLPALYAGARLFVYPSIYEGFGLPIAEAMASGVPVVTSGVSSMPEVAGGAARLVDPLDVEELREAIAAGLTDEAWRHHAHDAGLKRAAGFSWSACVSQTVEVYRRALS